MSTQQIVNYPFLYVNGLQLSWTSNTTLTVAAGIIRDLSNIADINLGNYLDESDEDVGVAANVATLLDTSKVGVNGIDTGVLAVSTSYYVYVIADTTGFRPSAVILSLGVIPVLPFGYDVYKRIGNVITDSSAHFLLFKQSGDRAIRWYQYDAAIAVLTTSGSTTPVAVSLLSAVPLHANVGIVALTSSFIANSAADSFSLRPTGGTAFPITVSSGVVTVAQKSAPFEMVVEQTATAVSIDYETTSGSDSLTLNVIGYVDNI
jgi:hypothetical protein